MTERSVQVRTLTDICREYGIVEVHFLKIDVEGAEKDVLCGLDLKTIRPWIIIAEATMPNTQIEDFFAWEPILLHNEYEYVYFDGLNRFYIAEEHQDLKTSLSIPPNVFDDFIQYDHSRLVHENHTLKNGIEAQKKQLEALYASNSWRITEPLRQISRIALRMTGKTRKKSRPTI